MRVLLLDSGERRVLAAGRTPPVPDINGPQRGWRQSCRQLQAGSLCSPELRAALLSFPNRSLPALLQSRRAPRFPRGALWLRGFRLARSLGFNS